MIYLLESSFSFCPLYFDNTVFKKPPHLHMFQQQDKERRLNGGDSGADDGGSTTGAEGLIRSRSINRHKLVAHSTAMESIQADSDPIDEEDHVP